MVNFLRAKWENIIMANYAVPIKTLKPYVPQGVEVDTYQGKAYLSLVGFLFKNTKIFGIPIPNLGNFEEVNLRFYVYRKEGNSIRRGVVFINETVPYKAVAWIANKLYKEHYTTVKTKSEVEINQQRKSVTYQWLVNKKWNTIGVEAELAGNKMTEDSFEHYIFEHYYGYTKLNENSTEEYHIHHPSWLINKVINAKVDCDFKAHYGNDFAFLNNSQPSNVFMAEGSAIEVKWKRNELNYERD